MEGEELIITRHLNRAYRQSNGITGDPSSSSSCKDEPMTPLARSTSTPNHNSSIGQQQTSDSTTVTHCSQRMTPQSAPTSSPHSSKLTSNNNISSPLMTLNNHNLTMDEPLESSSGSQTSQSNMAPPLNSMLQMANSLQSSNSLYNSSNSQGTKHLLNNSNLAHVSKSIDHMNLPSHHIQFQVYFIELSFLKTNSIFFSLIIVC